jgi:hypothetical protein
VVLDCEPTIIPTISSWIKSDRTVRIGTPVGG